MRFTDRLKISSLISFGLLLVLAPLLVWSSGDLKSAAANDILAGDLQTMVFERTAQRDEYFLYGTERARLQWLALTERIGQMLKQADRQFAGREERLIVKEMRSDFHDTVEIFQRLEAQAQRVTNIAGAGLLHDDELAKRLFGQTLIKASALRRGTGRLQALTRARHDHGINRNIALTALFVFLIGAVTTLNSTLITKLLRKRLQSLRSGAALIGGGDLDHRIECEGSDELAELCQVLNDMTARVQHYTKQLQKSHDLLNNLSDQVPGILFQACLSPDGHFSNPYTSKAIEDIYQIASEKVKFDAAPIFETFHPEDSEGIFASIHESARTLEPWEHEYRVILPSHGIKWLRGHARPMRQMDGGTLWHGFITDVTERKWMDDALHKSKQRFRQQLQELTNIYTHTPAGLFAVDRDLRFLRINERLAEINGRPIEEHLGRTIDEALPADLAAYLRVIWRPILERGQSVLNLELQGTVWWSPGVPRHWLASYHPLLTDDGDVAGVMGTVVDITDRKLAEESARNSERYMRETIDALSASICVLDERGTILSVNKSWREFALDNPPLIASFGIGLNYPALCDAVIGDEREEAGLFADGIFSVLHGETDFFAQEYQCHSDKEQRWFQGRVTRFGDEGVARIVVAHENITELKKTGWALQKSEERYRTLVMTAPITVVEVDSEGIIQFINGSSEGFGPSAAVGTSSYGYLEQESKEVFRHALEGVLTSRKQQRLVVRGMGNNGKMQWWETILGPMVIDGAVASVVQVSINITARKKIQDRLEKVTHEQNILFKTAPIGISKVIGRKQVLINRKIEEMFQYDKEQLVPQSTRMLYPSQEAYEKFGEEAYPALAKGEVYQSEQKLVRRDGSTIFVKYSGKALAPPDLSQGTIWTLEDITERKEAEYALREAYEELEQRVEERTAQLSAANRQLEKRIKERAKAKDDMLAKQAVLDVMTIELTLAEERERRRIAGELHDQVGQVLLLGRIKLGVLAGSYSAAPIGPTIEEIRGLIDAAIHDIRSLTFQLSPQLLCGVGLEAALEWLCRQLEGSYGLQVKFSDDKLPKPVPEELRHVVFQAVRELLINVKKHAQTDEAFLFLESVGDALRVTVEDRGVGFVPREPVMTKIADAGFGLFNSARRIEHMGGALTVESQPGQGTRAVIIIPILAAGDTGEKHGN